MPRFAALLLIGLLILVGNSTGQGAVWPLEDARVTGMGGAAERFVYVPAGQEWRNVALSIYADVAAPAYLDVWLDGRRAYKTRIERDTTVEAQLAGVLRAGFHKIELRTMSIEETGANYDYCSKSLRVLAAYSAVAVTFDRVIRELELRDLPDVLFNPQQPASRPWLGAVDCEVRDALAWSAIARLASGWRATAGIQWYYNNSALPRSADFVIAVKHVADLRVAARLRLVENRMTGPAPGSQKSPAPGSESAPPVSLEIFYRDDAGLWSAVSALLDRSYLRQLATTDADLLYSIKPPKWGGPYDPHTLADFGLDSSTLGGSLSRHLFLAVPAFWSLTGPVTGQLVVRPQHGLLQGSNVALSVDNALSGSIAFHEPPIKALEYLPFAGAYIPSSHLIDMRIDATLLLTGGCTPGIDGRLWVDAKSSSIEVAHRAKSGVAALEPALIARPLMHAQPSPGAFDALMALAQSLSDGVATGPLPFRVILGTGENADPAVRIRIDAGEAARLATRYVTQLNSVYAKNATWLIQRHSGIEILSADDQALVEFARNWNRARYDLLDGTRVALISSLGGVAVIEQAPLASLRANNHSYFQLAASALITFILAACGLLYWSLRRRRQAKQ